MPATMIAITATTNADKAKKIVSKDVKWVEFVGTPEGAGDA